MRDRRGGGPRGLAQAHNATPRGACANRCSRLVAPPYAFKFFPAQYWPRYHLPNNNAPNESLTEYRYTVVFFALDMPRAFPR